MKCFCSGQFGDFSWVWSRYRTILTTRSMGLTEQADIWLMQRTDLTGFQCWNCLFTSDLVFQNSLREAWMLPTSAASYANQLLRTVLRYHSSGNFHRHWLKNPQFLLCSYNGIYMVFHSCSFESPAEYMRFCIRTQILPFLLLLKPVTLYSSCK